MMMTFRILFVVLFALSLSSCALTAEAEKRVGCAPFSQDNPNLQNHQRFKFHAEGCGGDIAIEATFRGAAQHVNHPDSAAGLILRETNEAGTVISGNLCPPPSSDQNFNNFTVRCRYSVRIAPLIRKSYLLEYYTNHVAQMPTLTTSVRWVPTPQ